MATVAGPVVVTVAALVVVTVAGLVVVTVAGLVVVVVAELVVVVEAELVVVTVAGLVVVTVAGLVVVTVGETVGFGSFFRQSLRIERSCFLSFLIFFSALVARLYLNSPDKSKCILLLAGHEDLSIN